MYWILLLCAYTCVCIACHHNCSSTYEPTTMRGPSQDVNDHSPVFSEDRYEVEVTEDTAVGADLLTVSASDEDIGDNGRFQYSAAGQLVAVDGQTGNVSLQVVLDYETNESVEIEVRRRRGKKERRIEKMRSQLSCSAHCYWLQVTAADYGNPQRNGTTTVSCSLSR